MLPAAARLIPTPRTCAGLLALLTTVGLFASTGFGATPATQAPRAHVAGTLSLADPTAKGADPALCSEALAPLDTDDCRDVAYDPSTNVLKLGALSGTDVQAASLRWTVTTTNPTGYQVVMSNIGAAPLLRGGAGSIPDMSTGAKVPAAAVDEDTHFGVALGDASTDGEGSIPAAWTTPSGQQGELFGGIPTDGVLVARRTSSRTNDPFTATFAVAASAAKAPAPGSYAGTIRLVASAL